MGFEYVCDSCGKHLTIPPNLYEKRVKGRVVNVGCKSCGAPVRIDGTLPPPPDSAGTSAPAEPTSSQPVAANPSPKIPRAPRVPLESMPPVTRRLPVGRRSAPAPPPPPSDELDDAWDRPASEPPPPPISNASPELVSSGPPALSSSAPPSADPIPSTGPFATPLPSASPSAFPTSRPTPSPPPLPSPLPDSAVTPFPAPPSSPVAATPLPSSRPPRPRSPLPSEPPSVPPSSLSSGSLRLLSPAPSSEPTEPDHARPRPSPPPLPSATAKAESPPDSSPPSSASEADPAEFVASTGPSGDADEGAPISHATGPIYVRAPIAKIGRYALFDKFASGGMATVHMGRLDGAGGFSRVVAIKRLLPHLVQSSEFSEMLLNEARLAARVRHPNVVPTLDVVASKGEVLLVLEYVHGEALSALCRSLAKKRGVVPIGVAVSVMQGVLQGLHAVHEATDERGRSLGLVHRDVSPQNCMVGTDGMARVLDFGIVKALQQIEETVPNRLKGKTGYMSPEQIRGERLTRASDIFAAAIVLWELITLRRFCSGQTDKERIDKILSGDFARPGSHRLDLARDLDDVVMKALAFDANDRYKTAREFADALGACTDPASATTVTAWVEGLAEKTLLERARLLAQVENWDDGAPEIELSSTPFAVERAVLDLDEDPSGGATRSPVPTRSVRPSASSPPVAPASSAPGGPPLVAPGSPSAAPRTGEAMLRLEESWFRPVVLVGLVVVVVVIYLLMR